MKSLVMQEWDRGMIIHFNPSMISGENAKRGYEFEVPSRLALRAAEEERGIVVELIPDEQMIIMEVKR